MNNLGSDKHNLIALKPRAGLFVSFLSRFYVSCGDVRIVTNHDGKQEVSVDRNVETLLLQQFRLPELFQLLLVNQLMLWIIMMGLILVN